MSAMTRIAIASCFLLSIVTSVHATSSSDCLPVEISNPDIDVDKSVEDVAARAHLDRDGIFKTLRVVSKYETNGCWAGASGNSDGQYLSAGIMQWNLKQKTLQPLLKRFSEKFSSHEHFISVRDQLMPKYGAQLFDESCRSEPIGASCKSFLEHHYVSDDKSLGQDLKVEIDRLFNSLPMRQIQVDYFGRAFMSVLSDLDRIYATQHPEPWQIAWAIDVKTQQGNKFPTDKNIKKIKKETESESTDERRTRLDGIVKWFYGLCEEGTSEGVRYDCGYNIHEWPKMFDLTLANVERERTVHYSLLVARTAQNIDGAYQADSFERKATIAFGRGSVHRTIYDFSQP